MVFCKYFIQIWPFFSFFKGFIFCEGVAKSARGEAARGTALSDSQPWTAGPLTCRYSSAGDISCSLAIRSSAMNSWASHLQIFFSRWSQLFISCQTLGHEQLGLSPADILQQVISDVHQLSDPQPWTAGSLTCRHSSACVISCSLFISYQILSLEQLGLSPADILQQGISAVH